MIKQSVDQTGNGLINRTWVEWWRESMNEKLVEEKASVRENKLGKTPYQLFKKTSNFLTKWVERTYWRQKH